jgi:hypothetical protein
MLLQFHKIVRSCLDSGLVCSPESSLEFCTRNVFWKLLAWVKQKFDKLDMFLICVNLEAPIGNLGDDLTDKECALITASATFT